MLLQQMQADLPELRPPVLSVEADNEVKTAVDKVIAAVQELKMLGEYALPGTG
jgi:hypothetical protein